MSNVFHYLIGVHNVTHSTSVRTSQIVECACEMVERYYAEHDRPSECASKCLALAAYELALTYLDNLGGGSFSRRHGITDDSAFQAIVDGRKSVLVDTAKYCTCTDKIDEYRTELQALGQSTMCPAKTSIVGWAVDPC